MNQTAKNLMRVAGVVVGLGAAAWALRDRLLPAPEIHDEPPPRFREPTPSPTPDASGSSDDLTAIKGVGPVTARKLEDAGYSTLADIAAADAESLSTSVGTSQTTVSRWIEAAGRLA